MWVPLWIRLQEKKAHVAEEIIAELSINVISFSDEHEVIVGGRLVNAA